MILRWIVVVLLLMPCAVSAQYNFNNRDATKYVYKDIYKVHIPLDGAAVQYIPFRKDSLYGFVDKNTREFVIQPRFMQVFAVYPEGAIVEYKDGYGLVGYDDSFKIAPVFRNLFKEGDIYHGMLLAMDKKEHTSLSDYYVANYYFDKNGKLLFNNKAHEQSSFGDTDTLAWFQFEDTYTVYSRSGKLLKTFTTKTDTRFVGIFKNTLVFEKKEREHKYPLLLTGTDVKGKETFSLRPRHWVNANGVIKMSDSMYCLMEAAGETLLFFREDGSPYPFNVNDGTTGFGFRNLFPYFSQLELIPVRCEETDSKGMVSTNGSIVLPCQYLHIWSAENGEFAYVDSTRRGIGFMNAKGEITVPPVIPYDNADRDDFADRRFMYSDGLLLGHVRKDYYVDRGESRYLYTYYDREGKEVIRLTDSIILAHHFSGGLAAVFHKEKGLGFIDKQGKLVIPYQYEPAVAGAYPLPQIVIPEFINGFAYLKGYKGYIDDKGNEYFSGKRVKDHYDFSH